MERVPYKNSEQKNAICQLDKESTLIFQRMIRPRFFGSETPLRVEPTLF